MTRPVRGRVEGQLERLGDDRFQSRGVTRCPDVGRADGLAQDLGDAQRRVLGRSAAGEHDRVPDTDRGADGPRQLRGSAPGSRRSARGSAPRAPARPRSSRSCGRAAPRAGSAARSNARGRAGREGARSGRRWLCSSGEHRRHPGRRPRRPVPRDGPTGASIAQTRHHCVVNDTTRTGDTDAGRSHGSAGLEGRVRRLAPGRTRGPARSSSPSRPKSLGFESLWVFDHFHTVPEPKDEMTFESFAVLAALAVSTERVRLGHMVVCTGFRNPALTAKQSSTIDVISGGRFELGIGAGWKEDEWRAYGYGFPPLAERLAVFGDHLAVITEMFAPGTRHATRVATPTSARRSTSRAASRSRASRSSSAATGRGSRPAMPSATRTSSTTSSSSPTRSSTACATCASAARPKVATRRPCASRSTRATSRCATPVRPGSTASLASPRSDSTAWSRSRRAGHPRSRRRRPSPPTARRPGSRSKARVPA